MPGADVVLAPYSAVLMPDARESLGIELQDSVLVFDEAHNLLDAINSAHSSTVTGKNSMSSCITNSAEGQQNNGHSGRPWKP